MYSVAQAFAAKALLRLGQWAAGLKLIKDALDAVGTAPDRFLVGTMRLAFAELLAATPDANDDRTAEELATLAMASKGSDYRGSAHYVLAQVAYRRGDWSHAESAARIANEHFKLLPPQRIDVVPLWSRVLSSQGREAESMQVCEEAVYEMEALGIEPIGFLALLVALSEAQLRASRNESAKLTVERALPILRRRVADIPEPAWQATYLRKVSENIRLLELAARMSLDVSDLRQDQVEQAEVSS
jgi:hypothetical protein